ncbi:COX aromatic rich motif domain-containing protein [Ditylenchus destructor]|nr:COX aromatic rich motif domain-containing protein [Ditylenchus destructor]
MKHGTPRTIVSFAVLALTAFLAGCENQVLLSPKGEVGVAERDLMLFATGLMLLVVLPVIFMTLYFAWKYRADNDKAEYKPDWHHSTKIEAAVWLIPCAIIVVLGTRPGLCQMRFKAHSLDQAGFDKWVADAKASGQELSRERYASLVQPSEKAPVQHFAYNDKALFHNIVNRCWMASRSAWMIRCIRLRWFVKLAQIYASLRQSISAFGQMTSFAPFSRSACRSLKTDLPMRLSPGNCPGLNR